MTRPPGSCRKGPARADIAQAADDTERVKRAMIFWDFRDLGFHIPFLRVLSDGSVVAWFWSSAKAEVSDVVSFH